MFNLDRYTDKELARLPILVARWISQQLSVEPDDERLEAAKIALTELGQEWNRVIEETPDLVSFGDVIYQMFYKPDWRPITEGELQGRGLYDATPSLTQRITQGEPLWNWIDYLNMSRVDQPVVLGKIAVALAMIPVLDVNLGDIGAEAFRITEPWFDVAPSREEQEAAELMWSRLEEEYPNLPKSPSAAEPKGEPDIRAVTEEAMGDMLAWLVAWIAAANSLPGSELWPLLERALHFSGPQWDQEGFLEVSFGQPLKTLDRPQDLMQELLPQSIEAAKEEVQFMLDTAL